MLEYLDLRSIPAIHVRNTGAIIRKPDGTMIFGRAKHQQKGAADILTCYKGIAWAFETKAPKKYLRPEQKDWRDKWERHGGKYFMVRSLDEVLDAFGEKAQS